MKKQTTKQGTTGSSTSTGTAPLSAPENGPKNDLAHSQTLTAPPGNLVTNGTNGTNGLIPHPQNTPPPVPQTLNRNIGPGLALPTDSPVQPPVTPPEGDTTQTACTRPSANGPDGDTSQTACARPSGIGGTSSDLSTGQKNTKHTSDWGWNTSRNRLGETGDCAEQSATPRGDSTSTCYDSDATDSSRIY